MEKHEERIVYIALGIAAIGLVGGLMLAAFLAGLLVGRSPAIRNTQDTTALQKAKQLLVAQKKGGFPAPGTIAIIPGQGGANFTSPGTKLPIGSTLTWVNKSGETQTLITDSNSKNITIASGEVATMSFPEGGRDYTWHLQSNPQASVTVYVGPKG